MLPASIPSPSRGVVHLGPVPIRAYALFIVAGIVVAVIVADRRLRARGYRKGAVADIATWAVPFGLVGARLYHLATNPELYWGKNGQGTIAALEIWHGGLAIWGAIGAGAIGAWFGCRRHGVPFLAFADAAAPGVAFAQAIGRWGNYFNQELYGRPSGLPWAVHIDKAHRVAPYLNVATYQPTFLYESLWDLGVALLLLYADRRWRLARGQILGLYVAAYTAGRFWIEALRIDSAHRFFGLRINDWVSIVVFICGVAFFVLRGRARDGESAGAETPREEPDDAVAAP